MARITHSPDIRAERANTRPRMAPAPRAALRRSRVGTLLFGIAAYAVFSFTLLYAVGFVGNWIVPKSIDSGAPGAIVPSLLVNVALLLIVLAQHTAMARPAFKRWWTTFVPERLERSAFVLAASLSPLILFLFWQPLPATAWRIERPIAAAALTAVALCGWGLVFFGSFVIGHLDLFDRRHAWRGHGRALVAIPRAAKATSPPIAASSMRPLTLEPDVP